MNPTPFGWSSAYPPFILLAVLVSFFVTMTNARRERVSATRLAAIQLVLTATGLAGAAFYNMVETGTLADFDWRTPFSAGLRYPGGVIAVLLVVPVIRGMLPAGTSLAGALDLMSPGAAFGMATVRGGCFLMGCCYGRPSRMPWALSYPPQSQVARHHAMDAWIAPGEWSLPVHPLHLYFALASLIVGVVLLRRLPRRRYPGEIFLLYLALHEAAKGALEFLRGAPGGQSTAHLQAVSLTLSAIATAALLARRRAALPR